jgi:4'-phosphopantetheinyl transferase
MILSPDWTICADPPNPSDDDVHVWRISLVQPDHVIDSVRALLTPDEQARATRFHFARDRDRSIIGRGSLRVLLGRYLGTAPERVNFAYGAFGKPALANPSPGIEFNLTHAGELALCAVARRRPVGIDLEPIRPMPDAERIATRFFSPREQAELLGLPSEERAAAFLRCWTRKEAFIKALGEGLSHPLDQFDVTLAANMPARLVSVIGRPGDVDRWQLLHIDPGPAYVGALVVERPCASVCLLQMAGATHTAAPRSGRASMPSTPDSSRRSPPR